MLDPTLPQLLFPPFSPRLRTHTDGIEIYDKVRGAWVSLTPEEWVRQSLINYLAQHRAYPCGLMAVERRVMLNGMPQRADLVVYTNTMMPFLLVECKAPDVHLGDDAVRQAMRYNSVVKARFVAVTNGLTSLIFRVEEGGRLLYDGPDFPSFPR